MRLRYIPDAGRAYQITSQLLREPGWSWVLNFHYWNSYVIFALVMIHMLRVFVSGAYRRGKTGLWLIGVGLAGVVFLLSLTGETLHWDERGFAVPWHVAEFFEAIGLQHVFHYARDPDLLNVASATRHLIPFYALHVAILPIILFALIGMHYYLVKVKRISLPFWHKPSGHDRSVHRARQDVVRLQRRDPRRDRADLDLRPPVAGRRAAAASFLAVLRIRARPRRSRHRADVPDQLDTRDEPVGEPRVPPGAGHLGNRHRDGAHDGRAWSPSRSSIGRDVEPASWDEAFDLRQRGWAFLLMGIFWVTMITGVLTNAITPVG